MEYHLLELRLVCVGVKTNTHRDRMSTKHSRIILFEWSGDTFGKVVKAEKGAFIELVETWDTWGETCVHEKLQGVEICFKEKEE